MYAIQKALEHPLEDVPCRHGVSLPSHAPAGLLVSIAIPQPSSCIVQGRACGTLLDLFELLLDYGGARFI